MVEVEARSLSLRDEWYFTSCCHTPNQRLCQVVDRMSPLELGDASHVMTPPGAIGHNIVSVCMCIGWFQGGRPRIFTVQFPQCRG